MSNVNIGQNLIRIRKEKGITQKELAEITGMTPQALLKIEKGVTSPKTGTLNKLLKALDITEEDLYGEKDFYKMNFQLPFARNLKKILDNRGITESELADAVDVEVTKINDIINGRIIPNNNKLKQICDFLRISEEELMNNDMHTVSLQEVDMLNLIKERNCVMNEIDNIIRFSTDESVAEYIDEETCIDRQYPVYEQAKDRMIAEFKKMTLEELVSIYKDWMSKRIIEQADKV